MIDRSDTFLLQANSVTTETAKLLFIISILKDTFILIKVKVKVKQSRYSPGAAQRAPGS
jgi:hypothetical protein